MKTVLALLFICTTSLCNAQFLDKLGDKAANAVERTVERRVEKETTKSADRVLDTIVDSPKSKQKKKKKKKSKKSSNRNIIGGDPVDDGSKTTTPQNSDATNEEETEN